MHKITSIIRVEKWKKDGKLHVKSSVLIDDPDHLTDEFVGYGEYEVGQEVESYYSEKWDKATIVPHSNKNWLK